MIKDNLLYLFQIALVVIRSVIFEIQEKQEDDKKEKK